MNHTELIDKAEERINAIIDTYKQDIKGTLYEKLNQEDVKDFLVSLWVDCTRETARKYQAIIDKLTCCNNCKNMGFNRDYKSVCSKDIKKIDNPLTCKCDAWEVDGFREMYVFSDCGCYRYYKVYAENLENAVNIIKKYEMHIYDLYADDGEFDVYGWWNRGEYKEVSYDDIEVGYEIFDLADYKIDYPAKFCNTILKGIQE